MKRRGMGTPTVPSTTSEVEEIRRKMADIRLDLHRDVKSVRAGTEAATNWRYYAKHYPWPCLAAAVALGFFAVPRRHTTLKVVAPSQEPSEKVEKQAKKAGLFAIAAGFLGPIALRAAQNYVVNRLDTWMVEQGVGSLGGHAAASPADRAPRGETP
jgi:hypothetical protein